MNEEHKKPVRFDPVCPGCGKLMSEHEDTGFGFAMIYVNIRVVLVREMGFTQEESDEILRDALTKLFTFDTSRVIIGNGENGKRMTLGRVGGTFGYSQVVEDSGLKNWGPTLRGVISTKGKQTSFLDNALVPLQSADNAHLN